MIKFTLKNGQTVGVRPITKEDAALLVDFYYQLSADTRYKRFHANLENLPPEAVRAEAARLADIDHDTLEALAALDGQDDNEFVVGVARLGRQPGADKAEVAIVVRDDYQFNGLGTFLLRALGLRAREMGIKTLVGYVHADNRHVLHLTAKRGLTHTTHTSRGESYVEVHISKADTATLQLT